MTLTDVLPLIAFTSLGAALGFVIGCAWMSADADLDTASLQADLARWKARGAKEEARADRLEEQNDRLWAKINNAVAELTFDTADSPEAG